MLSIHKRTLQVFLCFLCISLIPTQEAHGFWWLLGRAALSAGRMVLGRTAISRTTTMSRATASRVTATRTTTNTRALQRVNNTLDIATTAKELGGNKSIPPSLPTLQPLKKEMFDLSSLSHKNTKQDAEQTFLLGYRLFTKGHYPQSLLQLTSFIEAHPHAKTRVFDALHWIMESFRQMNDEESAHRIEQQMARLRQNAQHATLIKQQPIQIGQMLLPTPLTETITDTLPATNLPLSTALLDDYALTEEDLIADDNQRSPVLPSLAQLETND